MMKLTSTAFGAGGAIPARYPCDGADVSPPLAWSDALHGAKSFALVVDDPDAPDPKAPRKRWVHVPGSGLVQLLAGLGLEWDRAYLRASLLSISALTSRHGRPRLPLEATSTRRSISAIHSASVRVDPGTSGTTLPRSSRARSMRSWSGS